MSEPTQEEWEKLKQKEKELQRKEAEIKRLGNYSKAVLDSLSCNIAVVDEKGIITNVNEAWLKFAVDNGLDTYEWIGVNYLEICDQACGSFSEEGSSVGEGLRNLLSGEIDYFELEYPCHSPFEKRWFLVHLTAFEVGNSYRGAVVTHTNISDRKKAEEELKKSNQLLNKLTNQVPGLIYQYRIDPDGEMSYPFVSQQVVELFGHPVEAIKADPANLFERIFHEDVNAILESLQYSYENMDKWEADFRVNLPEKGIRWIRAAAIPEKEDTGAVLWHGYMTDITDKIDARKELLIKDQAIRSSINAISLADLSGITTYVNPSFLELWGYDHESEVIGRPIYDFVDDFQKARSVVDDLFGKGSWKGQLVGIKKDGSKFDLNLYASIVLDQEGNPVRLMSSGDDATERNQYEARLRESEREKDLILSSISEKVVYHDLNLNIRWANRAACESFGHESEYLIGQKCYEILTREVEECEHCPVKKVLKTGQYHEETISFISGETYSIRAYPAFDDNKTLIGVVEVTQNITIQKQIEAELVQARDAAEAANEAKSRFLSNMSHEIRTPMNVIIGMSNLLGETTINTRQQEYMGMIKESARSLLSIINDILDFSKIEADCIELSYSKFDLKSEIEKLISSFNLGTDNKELQLGFKIDSAVPAVLIGDPFRIRQVLLNLIGNAIKYTEQGSIFLHISPVSGAEDIQAGKGIALCFSLKDTGIGIPSDKLNSLFKSFTRVDRGGAMQYEGTGLGLAISKNLVDLMGGKIEVESEIGRGSIFSFTIPFQLPEEEEVLEKEPEKIIEQSGAEHSTANILLVEDKPMNQKLATVVLEKMGHHVTAASNGKKALEAYRSNSYDLILMDINMPEMDGLEATSKIRALENIKGLTRIPIIAMTAYAMKGDEEKCLEAGMDYYISKPIKFEELQEIISRALDN